MLYVFNLICLHVATMESVTTVNCPFTEEDLTLLYPNPQLASNPEFVENFLKVSVCKMS